MFSTYESNVGTETQNVIELFIAELVPLICRADTC